jgi:pantetheine-phosphate adenylyltransferase
MRFNKVALGGTFDRFHKGHEQLIRKAAEVGEEIVLGLTVDGFSSTKELSDLIQPYNLRKQELTKGLVSLGVDLRTTIVPLEDVFGPTLNDGKIDGLVVTRQTKGGAEIVNRERGRIGLSKLPIIEAELVKDKNGDYLSSTSIRRGLVDREGVSYVKLFSNSIKLIDNKKNQLKTPMGEFFAKDRLDKISKLIGKYRVVALVGDISTELFIKNDWGYDLAFFDNKVQRKRVDIVGPLLDRGVETIKLDNPPGTINGRIAKIIFKWNVDEKLIFEIEGEEDLLVLPLIMLLPLESLVIYGQPNEGLVLVSVDEKTKNKYFKFLRI